MRCAAPLLALLFAVDTAHANSLVGCLSSASCIEGILADTVQKFCGPVSGNPGSYGRTCGPELVNLAHAMEQKLINGNAIDAWTQQMINDNGPLISGVFNDAMQQLSTQTIEPMVKNIAGVAVSSIDKVIGTASIDMVGVQAFSAFLSIIVTDNEIHQKTKAVVKVIDEAANKIQRIEVDFFTRYTAALLQIWKGIQGIDCMVKGQVASVQDELYKEMAADGGYDCRNPSDNLLADCCQNVGVANRSLMSLEPSQLYFLRVCHRMANITVNTPMREVMAAIADAKERANALFCIEYIGCSGSETPCFWTREYSKWSSKAAFWDEKANDLQAPCYTPADCQKASATRLVRSRQTIADKADLQPVLTMLLEQQHEFKLMMTNDTSGHGVECPMGFRDLGEAKPAVEHWDDGKHVRACVEEAIEFPDYTRSPADGSPRNVPCGAPDATAVDCYEYAIMRLDRARWEIEARADRWDVDPLMSIRERQILLMNTTDNKTMLACPPGWEDWKNIHFKLHNDSKSRWFNNKDINVRACVNATNSTNTTIAASASPPGVRRGNKQGSSRGGVGAAPSCAACDDAQRCAPCKMCVGTKTTKNPGACAACFEAGPGGAPACLSDDWAAPHCERCWAGDERNHPVIFVATMLGTELRMTWDKAAAPHADCARRQARPDTVWPLAASAADLAAAPRRAGCAADNLRLTFDNASKTYDELAAAAGGRRITTHIGPYGAPPGDHDGLVRRASATFAGVAARLERAFNYSRYTQMRVMPYDWRLGPREFAAPGGEYEQLRGIVEGAYARQGKSVVLLSHSMGSPFTHRFLMWGGIDEAWKSKHVRGWVSSSGSFAGTVQTLRDLLSGDELVASPVLDAAQYRDAISMMGAAAMLTPRPAVGIDWGALEGALSVTDPGHAARPVVTSPRGSFTAAGVRGALVAALRQARPEWSRGTAQGALAVHDWEHAESDTTGNPGVRTWCFYADGSPTPQTLRYSDPDLNDVQPAVELGAGDGVVPLASLAQCSAWRMPGESTADAARRTRVSHGVEHAALLDDDATLRGLVAAFRDPGLLGRGAGDTRVGTAAPSAANGSACDGTEARATECYNESDAILQDVRKEVGGKVDVTTLELFYNQGGVLRFVAPVAKTKDNPRALGDCPDGWAEWGQVHLQTSRYGELGAKVWVRGCYLRKSPRTGMANAAQLEHFAAHLHAGAAH